MCTHRCRKEGSMETSGNTEELLRERLAVLSLEQKVRLLTGADFWALYAEPDIGLRRIVTSDGPAGVRGEKWDDRDPSANVPSPTALAATWDEELLERIGRLLAAEARRKGVDVLLAPTVNLHRTSYGGRHFENLSEDPLLTGRLGAAYVRGVQSGGVAATVKHFVANDSETERFTANVVVDERSLRELYLTPFEIILRDAGAWAVMAAYNSVNGPTMTENPLLRDVLKGEWGFDGVVVSDWFAGRSLAAADEGLLDLVMPGPKGPWGEALVEAIRGGRVPESAVDDKVLRVLRLAARVGALDGVTPAVDGLDDWPRKRIAGELRDAAAAGFVLVRNESAVLPLDRARLRRVAVVGPNAAVARTLGGGSATVFPEYVVSPLEGIRAALGDGVEVTHSTGGRATDRLPPAPLELLTLPDGSGPGVEVRFLAADGSLLGDEHRRTAALTWLGELAPDLPVSAATSVEVHTRLTAPEAGSYLLGASGLGGFRIRVDGETVLDTVITLSAGVDPVEGMMRPPQESVPIELAAGQQVSVVLRHEPQAADAAFGGAELGALMFQQNIARQVSDDEELDQAVALAADADVAVVVVGTTEEVESEGFDRTTLGLPGRQDELVRRVARANARTVVVVNAGAPVLMPWADDVSAVLLAWFPGQEFGHALADVLLGVVEPGGRLPTTWPVGEENLPTVTPVDGQLVYDESLFIGYRAYDRAGWEPRYPFGHGLGYTGWDFLAAEMGEDGDGSATVTVRVRNTGNRPGREVVQVYASRPDSAVERPVRWLAGFGSVNADPGAEAAVTVALPASVFRHWDPDAGRWATEPGSYRLEIGNSSRNLPLTTAVG
ncbi:MAG: glycoside hydrolase family 3 protein [Jiangellaceae bacterium]|nr:glycoside hydrolase family 3 protein [Jiangellaceae bacterium]